MAVTSIDSSNIDLIDLSFFNQYHGRTKGRKDKTMDDDILSNDHKSAGRDFPLEVVLKKAKAKMAELTGFTSLVVVEAHSNVDGSWALKIEMVERESIPSILDLIGLYEVTLDRFGIILGYSRKNIRKRGEGYSKM